MKTIKQLVNEFQDKHADTYTNDERVNIIRNLITEHGYDAVAEATGYKVSTLNMVTRGAGVQLSDVRVRQAVYVFDLLSEK